MTIREFKVSVDESKIDDLYKRIDLTRWPDEVNDEIWTLGTKKSFLKDSVQYWRNDFDWKIHEKQINDFGSYKFKTKDDLEIHFIHSKSVSENSIPIIITHGWPGSIQEFFKIIPLLNKDKDGLSFDVVCPSMPGYGFSDKPSQKGYDSKKIAEINHELMTALGYKKYLVQGGDWGSTVSKWSAELFPNEVLGLHLNLVIAFPPEKDDPMEGVTDQEKVLLGRYAKYLELGSGYFEIQRTKPQTLGYSLNDSPVGLAGWIIEKFHSWTDDERDKLIVSLEDVLSIVSLYWFSESITSSMRLYNENGREGFSKSKVEVPTGCALFKNEIMLPPKAWAEEIYNLVHWEHYDGGHFAALEKPETLEKDIRLFVQKLKI
jgi:pimeloyl-ACP methyl ester carboxylesterase